VRRAGRRGVESSGLLVLETEAEHRLEVVCGELLKGDHGLRALDPIQQREPLGDDLGQLVVLAHTHANSLYLQSLVEGGVPLLLANLYLLALGIVSFGRRAARSPLAAGAFGATLALAGLNACAQPPHNKIVPYVHQPENIVPGKPLYFATAFALSGYATGILVESHEGRPTKIEGNPNHPASLGATDAFAQASVLTLYDPDRSQTVLHHGTNATWVDFLKEFSVAVDAQRGKQGAGLRILTETVTSPTLANQLKTILQTFPSAKWHQYEPLGRDNGRAGAHLAFGQYVETRYDFSKADVISTQTKTQFRQSTACSIYCADCLCGRHFETPSQEWLCPQCNRHIVLDWGYSQTAPQSDCKQHAAMTQEIA